MKKGWLVLATVMLVIALAPEPAAAKVTFNLGLKAGLSLSNVAWSDESGSTPILRPTAGVLGVIDLSPMFTIQAELDYVIMGEWYGYDVWKWVEDYSYLQIPVLLRARLVREAKISPFLTAGPVLGFLLSAHEKQYLNGEFDGDFDIKFRTASTDFGAALGGGAEFKVGPLKVFLDARFYLGFTNAYRGDLDMTMRTRALVLAGGVLF